MDFLRLMRRLSRDRAAGLAPVPSGDLPPVRSFRAALSGMAVIAEVKYATPGDGRLGVTEGPDELARQYQSLGAAAVSCLTEPFFFGGSLEHLSLVRSSCSLPLLMKDFITAPEQIAAGRRLGADAFLLITEMLEPGELKDLYACGGELGMDCLVEVHGWAGLEKALAIGADIIGVNCRDLATLAVDPDRHREMARHLPAGVKRIAESGITDARRIGELGALGYDAALVGRAMASAGLRKEILSCG